MAIYATNILVCICSILYLIERWEIFGIRYQATAYHSAWYLSPLTHISV